MEHLMSYQLDATVTDVAKAMTLLRDALRGIPVRNSRFTDAHTALCRSMSNLITGIEDSRHLFRDEH
jgi:hypothetical protein